MKQIGSRMGRGAFALALAGVLGFGASQALADTTPVSRAENYCDKTECLEYCGGRCMTDEWGNVVCVCPE